MPHNWIAYVNGTACWACGLKYELRGDDDCPGVSTKEYRRIADDTDAIGAARDRLFPKE